MWIVALQDRSRHTLRRIQPVEPSQQRRLTHAVTKARLSQSGDIQASERVSPWLLGLKQRGYWLACDCRSDPAPVMTVCRRHQSVYLRRVISFPEHASRCPFYREPPADQRTEPPRKRPAVSQGFGVYQRDRDVDLSQLVVTASRQTPSIGSTRLPKLGRCLFRLVEAAGLTQWAGTMPSIVDQYSALHEATTQFDIVKGRALNEFFWTFPSQVGFAGLTVHRAAKHWPSASSPHGFVCVIAQAIEGNQILCQHKNTTITINVTNKLQLSSGRLGRQSAPFLVLLTIAAPPDQSRFLPFDAFAVPVDSTRCLMPIESHYERVVFQQLIKIQHSLQRRGITLTIEKPLFDLPVRDHHCRPDFCLRASGKTIILEVMGSHEADYFARKARTHPLMQQLGTLIEIDAYEAAQSNAWEPYLTRMTQQIYRELFKNNHL